MRKLLLTAMLSVSLCYAFSQPINFNQEQISFDSAPIPEGEINISGLQWLPGSHDFWVNENGNIYVYSADDLNKKNIVLSADQIKQSGLSTKVEKIIWSEDRKKLLIYTNSSLVWREKTKGDYWYFDLATGKGIQLAKKLPSSFTQFAKFSPDGKKVGYVNKHNLFVEDLTTKKNNSSYKRWNR